MKDTVTQYTFTDTMIKHGFSYEGTKALFEHFEQYEENCDQELEFDPIAFCCEYSEYEDMEEFWQNYDKEDYPDEESIMDNTFYWAFGDSFIIQQF